MQFVSNLDAKVESHRELIGIDRASNNILWYDSYLIAVLPPQCFKRNSLLAKHLQAPEICSLMLTNRQFGDFWSSQSFKQRRPTYHTKICFLWEPSNRPSCQSWQSSSGQSKTIVVPLPQNNSIPKVSKPTPMTSFSLIVSLHYNMRTAQKCFGFY